MKNNIKLSIVAIISVMNLVYAGGDISPITPYETSDVQEANLEAVEVAPVPEIEEPVEVEETEVVVPTKETQVVENETVITPPKEIKNIPPVIPASVNSGVGAYASLGGVVARYNSNCDCKTSNTSGKDKTAGVIGKVGYNINKYIGIEARGVSTMIKDNGAKVTHYGAYVKPMLPITNKVKAYGLVGYGKSKTTGHLRKADVSGLAWGLGVDYAVTDKVSAFVDYQKLINKSDSKAPKLDTVNIGANYNF
jgi:opacity protein-like surface antigen